MSKIIYICNTEEEFRELCTVFKFHTAFQVFTWEDICLRVVDGVALDWGLVNWYVEEEEFTDYRFIRYRKGMSVYVKDVIKSPFHYRLEGLDIESKDIIKSVLKTQFKAFCIGNALKYLIRAEKKNGLEDYKKAKVYLDWIIEEMED